MKCLLFVEQKRELCSFQAEGHFIQNVHSCAAKLISSTGTKRNNEAFLKSCFSPKSDLLDSWWFLLATSIGIEKLKTFVSIKIREYCWALRYDFSCGHSRVVGSSDALACYSLLPLSVFLDSSLLFCQ